jgi:lipopolysaccharide transport system permease protein
MRSAPRHAGRTEQPTLLRPPPARIYRSEIVIRPSAVALGVQFRELWRFRHLLLALVWRNVRVEFDATRLGSLWAVVRPLMFTAVFALFRNFSGADTRVEFPYTLYLYTGLLLWTYFTDAAANSASAVRMDTGLLTKVYYPRMITPCVPTMAGLLTLVIGMVPLIGMMIWYDIYPGFAIILLPVVLLPCVMLALGLGLIFSSMSLTNRDWERVLQFALTIGLWISPVIYHLDMIPDPLRWIYHLNPTVGPLMGFRAALFDGIEFPVSELAYSFACASVILAVGIWVFRRTEIRLVDRL